MGMKACERCGLTWFEPLVQLVEVGETVAAVNTGVAWKCAECGAVVANVHQITENMKREFSQKRKFT